MGWLSKDKGNATTILYHHCYYEGDCRAEPVVSLCVCVYVYMCVSPIRPRADGALRILRLMRTRVRGLG